MRATSNGACFFAALSLLACDEPDVGQWGEQAGDEPVAQARDALEVCTGPNVVHGIDVSYYQGDIDWTAVAGAGYGFAIARINHGDFMDPKFDQNWAGIQAVGLVRGAYQYFDPGGDVVAQAQTVIDKLGILAPDDLPAVLDLESTDGLSPDQVADAAGTWLQLVEEGTGKRPIIYTGKYFFQDNVATTAFSEYPLWHAQYPNACQPPAEPPPACGCANIADQWSDFAMWQYSSSGSVPGIAGNVDLNVFKGTLADLMALAHQGGYAARVDEVSAPSVVLAGEAFDVSITVTNTGGTPWGGSTMLGTSEPRDRASLFEHESWLSDHRLAAVEGSILPGESYTFELKLAAPSELGTYAEHFALLEEGVSWFADQGGPSDDAIALSLQVVDVLPGPEGGGGSGAAGSGSGGGSSDDGEGGDGCAQASAAPRGSAWWLAWLLMCGARARRRRE